MACLVLLGYWVYSSLFKRISLSNDSKFYSVDFASTRAKSNLSKRIGSWGMFEQNGVVFWETIDRTSGAYKKASIKRLTITFTDDEQNDGQVLTKEEGPVVSSYDFTVKDGAGYLTVHFNDSEFKNFSEEERTRRLNAEIVMGLFEATHRTGENAVTETVNELGRYETEPINEISYFIFTNR